MSITPRSKRKRKSVFKLVLLVLFILFLILNYFKWQPFHSILFPLSGSVLKTKEVVLSPFANVFSYFDSKKRLEEEKDKLKKEVTDLKMQALSFEILKFEYKNLKNQFDDKNGSSVEIGKIILKPPFSGFDNLVIGGEFDESKIGQKVFYRNIILGEIVEVRGDNAIVRLYSASGNSSSAKLKDGNLFEVVGKGYGQYEMTLPKDIEIEEGDPLIYPDNEVALFGIVNKVFSTDDDLFNKVLFNIPIDFAEINYVRIGYPLNILE